jgi:hypothetical protein
LVVTREAMAHVLLARGLLGYDERQKAIDAKSRMTSSFVKPTLVILCAALFGSVSLAYLMHISSQGVTGSDAFNYIDVAKSWADGNVSPTNRWAGFRPVAYALHALAIITIGFTDYSIKIFHVLTAALSVIVVIHVLRRMGTTIVSAVLAGFALAVTPAFVYYSRIELVHVPSTFFLLLSFLCYVKYHYTTQVNDRKAMLWVLLCGVASSLGWGTHPSLILIAVPFGILIALSSNAFRLVRVLPTIAHLALYGGGYLTVVIVSTPWLGEVFADFAGRTAIPPVSRSFIGTVGILIANLSYFVSTLVLTLFIALNLAGVVAVASGPKRDLVGFAPLLIVTVYFTLFAGFTALGMTVTNVSSDLLRIMLPFIPFVLIGIFYWSDFIMMRLLPSKVFIVGPLLTVLYLGLVPNLPYFSVVRALVDGRQTEYRAVWDVLSDKVSPTSRLLVAGSLAYLNTRRYMQEIYFGKNALYLFDCDEDNLAAFLDRNHVRWIYVAGAVDQRILNRPTTLPRYDPQRDVYVPRSAHLGNCLGIKAGEFSREDEMRRLVAFLKKDGAKRVGTIQRRPLFERLPRGVPID